MANTNTLPATKYQNNARTISGTGNSVRDDDVSLNCDTTLGVVGIDLALIPANFWSTTWRIYITDSGNNASVNNVTINAPVGYFINGVSSYVLSTNGQSIEVFITSNINYGVSNAINTPPVVVTTLPVKNTVYVMKNGNNSTALVERMDKPFLTIAAARTAALAFYTGGSAPSATNRILIEVYSGYYLEPIILDNFIDYDLRDSVVSQTATGDLISDNGVQVDSIIYGQANLFSVTAGGSATRGIYISNASSSVIMNYSNLYMTGTSSSVIRGIHCKGTLDATFNNLTVTESSGNAVGILADTGTIFAQAKGNISVSTTGLQNGIASVGVGAKLYFNGNDVTASGTTDAAMATVSAQLSGKAWIKCNNLYHTSTGGALVECGAILLANGSPEIYVKCNNIIVSVTSSNEAKCCQFGRSSSTQTTGGIMNVECVKATVNAKGASNNAIAMEYCDVNSIATFKGKYVVVDDGGTNVDCVVNKTGGGTPSLGTLIIDNATLIAIGTGKCLASSGSPANAYVYGSCQSNKAVSADVTLLVGTVGNGRFIENDSNVI